MFNSVQLLTCINSIRIYTFLQEPFQTSKLPWDCGADGVLNINHDNHEKEEGHKMVRKLTEKDVNDLVSRVNPKEVISLQMECVDFGDSSEMLFKFISDLKKCTRFALHQVKDNTENNEDLSQALVSLFTKCNKLYKVEICKTEMGKNWDNVLNSISDITLLRVHKSNMSSHGPALSNLITRCPSLVWLSLKHTKLGGKQLQFILSKLPKSCPLLKSLLVKGHDLSNEGKELAKVVGSLPKLEVLNIGECHLKEDDLCAIFENINQEVNRLYVHQNDAFCNGIPERIKTFNALIFMKVSSFQFSPVDLSQLRTFLPSHGCVLAVDDKQYTV